MMKVSLIKIDIAICTFALVALALERWEPKANWFCMTYIVARHEIQNFTLGNFQDNFSTVEKYKKHTIRLIA